MFLLIKNADVYAPAHLGLRDVLVCDEKIVKIAEKIDFAWDGLRQIDAGGKRLIPGLIDQHVHITGGGGESGFTSRVPELRFSDSVRAGVTTLVGLLGTDSRTRDVRNLIAKTKALNEEGITAFCLTGAYELPSPTLTGSVGDDIVFIDEVIGVKVAISDHRSSNSSKEQMIALASEARIAGLLSKKPGVVHMHTGVGKQGLKMILDIVRSTDIPIKVFRPTHMRKMLEDDVVEFAELGGFVDYTSGEAPDEKAKEIADVLARGIDPSLLTISSDSNGSMPKWGPNKELVGITYAKMTSLFGVIRSLVNTQNMPLEKALPFVSENVAKALAVFPQKGCIATGSDADFVLLDEQMQMKTVIARGKVLVQDYQVLKKGFFED